MWVLINFERTRRFAVLWHEDQSLENLRLNIPWGCNKQTLDASGFDQHGFLGNIFLRNVLSSWLHPWLNGTVICFLSERASLCGVSCWKSWGRAFIPEPNSPYEGLGNTYRLIPSNNNMLILPVRHLRELKSNHSATGKMKWQKRWEQQLFSHWWKSLVTRVLCVPQDTQVVKTARVP